MQLVLQRSCLFVLDVFSGGSPNDDPPLDNPATLSGSGRGFGASAVGVSATRASLGVEKSTTQSDGGHFVRCRGCNG